MNDMMDRVQETRRGDIPIAFTLFVIVVPYVHPLRSEEICT